MNTNDIIVNKQPNRDPEYVRLVSLISKLWDGAKANAAIAINKELLDANWLTGQYIVEFEQGGNAKAKYGDKLISNLASTSFFSTTNILSTRLLESFMVFNLS